MTRRSPMIWLLAVGLTGSTAALALAEVPMPGPPSQMGTPTPQKKRPSLEAVTKACHSTKSPKACAEAGLRYQDGDGTAVNTKAAAVFFGKACKLGSHVGCSDLAALKLDGDGVPKDIDGAVKLLRASCDAKYGRACAGLGMLADRGTWPKGPPKPEVAAKLYKQSCEYGSPWGCGLLGYAIVTSSKPDFAQARTALAKGCKGDSPQACTLLGKLLVGGKGGKKDPAAAAKVLLKGCRGGRTDACRLLARIYAKGVGVKKDPAVAAAVLKASCKANDMASCNTLGKMCVKGEGLPLDYACARSQFTKACKSGYGAACTNMGVMHTKGLRVSKSTKAAAKFYRQGCAAGHQKGCVALKDLCKTGERSACGPAGKP